MDQIREWLPLLNVIIIPLLVFMAKLDKRLAVVETMLKFIVGDRING